MPDFTRDAVDVANQLRYRPRGTGCTASRSSISTLPGVQPRVRGGRSAACAASRTTRLIHVAQTPDAWSGCCTPPTPAIEPRRHVTYDHVSIALSARVGQGVALSTAILLRRAARRGQAVPAVPRDGASGATYHFVCRPRASTRRASPRSRLAGRPPRARECAACKRGCKLSVLAWVGVAQPRGMQQLTCLGPNKLELA